MNIDTTTIEGFDAMTAEQKIDALLKVEIPELPDMSKYVLKETFDKKASETAELSKQLKARLTAEEQKSLADKETQEAYEARLQESDAKIAELQKKITVSEHKNKFLALGYDEKLAAETAEALANGDVEKVFANQQKFNATLETRIKADLMKKTHAPDGVGGEGKHTDSAVEKARELAKAKQGGDKTYADIMSKYK